MTDEQRELPLPGVQAAPHKPLIDWRTLSNKASRAFRPTAPVDVLDIFAGRETQIDRVCDAIMQEGQHAILFGERGVGKTSLANVLSEYLRPTEEEDGHGPIVSPRVNCDVDDDFDSVWRKVFAKIDFGVQRESVGFVPAVSNQRFDANAVVPADYSGRKLDPEGVRRTLTTLGEHSIPILIIDEFDRLRPEVRRVFADTIKSLSDHATQATIVLVGVSESVDGLLTDHESIGRALVQVHMPRMTPKEIRQLLVRGAGHLGMSFESSALARIICFSQGLPHYAHLLGLYSVRAALRDTTLHVANAHVEKAVVESLANAQQSVQKAYYDAVRSPQPGNLYSAVLLACAMAKTDDLGYFKAQDVRTPMCEITGRNYDIPNFAQHLSEFSSEKRGRILLTLGEQRRKSYHFRDPLMQPFVIMQGQASGQLPDSFFEAQQIESQ